ncbi:MAG: hypothetical protein ACREQA_10370 [Candidatus Binatia bacterium]
MTLEVAGFIIGIIGAIWMKNALNLLNRERKKPEIEKIRPRLEDPALEAFIKGLTLILIGLGMETIARLFLN